MIFDLKVLTTQKGRESISESQKEKTLKIWYYWCGERTI